MLKAVKVLCFAVPLACAFLTYTAPETGHSLTLCTCAKCGSTSLALGMYLAVTGHDYSTLHPRPKHPWPHNVDGWKDHPDCARAPACAKGIHAFVPGEEPKSGDITVVVTRDPLERYVSAFHSKIACCGSPRAGTPRRSCFHDRGERRVVGLLSLAGLPPLEAGSQTCLYWGEYSDALTRIQRLGRQTDIDIHFKPQPSGCNYSTALLVDLSGIGALLSGLQGFGPVPQRYPKGKHSHASVYRSNIHTNATTLCEVALPEYAAIGGDVPAECSLSRAVAS